MAINRAKRRTYTISDIADALQLSKSTVSRAISGKGRLSPETRIRVQQFMEQHDYHLNAVAKSLAHGKTYNLGLILPPDYRFNEPAFFQECMVGICTAAIAFEYDILIIIADEHSTHPLARIVNNDKVDGVIISRSVIQSKLFPLLREKDFPFVLIGETNDPTVLHVDNNNQAACKELTMLLLQKGLHRLSLLGGTSTHAVSLARRRGFEDAHTVCAHTVPNDLIFMDMDHTDDIHQALSTAVARGADCIVCMDDYICSLALTDLRERRLRIPEDIQLVSFYDSVLLENSTPSVTSLHFHSKDLGADACRKLIGLLDGTSLPCQQSGYEIKLRGSTR